MKKKMKKSLILLLSLLMVLTMMPMGVWAEEGGTGEADPAPADNVAKIGETEYETLKLSSKPMTVIRLYCWVIVNFPLPME